MIGPSTGAGHFPEISHWSSVPVFHCFCPIRPPVWSESSGWCRGKVHTAPPTRISADHNRDILGVVSGENTSSIRSITTRWTLRLHAKRDHVGCAGEVLSQPGLQGQVCAEQTQRHSLTDCEQNFCQTKFSVLTDHRLGCIRDRDPEKWRGRGAVGRLYERLL